MGHKVISNNPMHIHPRLEMDVRGKRIPIPAEVGIKAKLYKDHEFDAFIGDMGAAPIHTHDASGTLHVESSVTMDYTLGDFFKIWGKAMPAGATVTVDGHTVKRPASHVLHDGEQIRISVP